MGLYLELRSREVLEGLGEFLGKCRKILTTPLFLELLRNVERPSFVGQILGLLLEQRQLIRRSLLGPLLHSFGSLLAPLCPGLLLRSQLLRRLSSLGLRSGLGFGGSLLGSRLLLLRGGGGGGGGGGLLRAGSSLGGRQKDSVRNCEAARCERRADDEGLREQLGRRGRETAGNSPAGGCEHGDWKPVDKPCRRSLGRAIPGILKSL